MKALVIGMGGVGCALAIASAKASMDTAVLARSTTAQAIRNNGLKRTGIFGDITIPASSLTVFDDYDSITSQYDFVIISTKTMANESVAKELASHRYILGQTGRIVIFQNGWGNDESYLKYFPASQVFNARVITGFERTAPNVTNVTVHTAPVLLGSLHGESIKELEPLANAIASSGIPAETSEELEKALWAKMLYNTTLNPLGAILNMTYGQLASSKRLIGIMNNLIDETYAVMDAAGYKTFWATAQEYKDVFYGKLVPDTFAHHPSTLQDIKKGQRTEIDTLNGCILILGKKYGIMTPTHAMIVELTKGLEEVRCQKPWSQ